MTELQLIPFLIGVAAGVVLTLTLTAAMILARNAGRGARAQAALQGAAPVIESGAAPVGAAGCAPALVVPSADSTGSNPAHARRGVDSKISDLAESLVAPAHPVSKQRAQIIPLRPACDHARALLDWLQGPGGLTGEITASEMESIYAEMSCELRWAPRPWAPVASELRKLLGGEKFYGYRDGQRCRVWRIPAAHPTAEPSPLVLARAA